MEKIKVTCSYGNTVLTFILNKKELRLKRLKEDIIKSTNLSSFIIINNNIEIVEDNQLVRAVESGTLIEIFNSELEDSNLFDNAAIEESIIPGFKPKECSPQDQFWSELSYLSNFFKGNYELASYLNNSLKCDQNDLANELSIKAQLKTENEQITFIKAEPKEQVDFQFIILNKSYVSLANYNISFNISSDFIKIKPKDEKTVPIGPNSQQLLKYQLIIGEVEKSSEVKVVIKLSDISTLKCNNLELTVLIEVDELMKFITSKTKNPYILELCREKLQLLQMVNESITPHLTLDEVFKAHCEANWNSDQAVQILFQDN